MCERRQTQIEGVHLDGAARPESIRAKSRPVTIAGNRGWNVLELIMVDVQLGRYSNTYKKGNDIGVCTLFFFPKQCFNFGDLPASASHKCWDESATPLRPGKNRTLYISELYSDL